MKKFSILFFVLILAAIPALAQVSDKRVEQFKALHKAEEQAEVKRDIPALERFLTTDFTFIAANGAIYDKKAFIDEIRNDTSTSPVQELTYDDFKVRDYGKSALVNYLLLVAGKDKDGKPTLSRYRMSVVWVKHGRDWRISNFHSTRVR